MSEFTRVMATFAGDYEGLKAFGAYLGTFQASATQLKEVEMAHEWYLSGTAAEDAAQWASRGHLPQTALPLIASEMTPELAAGADASPLEMIARLADAGVITEGADLSALDEQ